MTLVDRLTALVEAVGTDIKALNQAKNMSAKCISVTGTSGTDLVCTLPAEPGKFHYITGIDIVLYAKSAKSGAATPNVITTTNIPGDLAYTFATHLSAGDVVSQSNDFAVPIKSLLAGTATTFSAPATANGIWRITVRYYSET